MRQGFPGGRFDEHLKAVAFHGSNSGGGSEHMIGVKNRTLIHES